MGILPYGRKQKYFFLLLCTSSFAEEKAVSLFDQHFNDYSENLADAIDTKKAGIFG
jgi:hypothetical protein